MLVQLEGKIWIAAHGFSVIDAGKNDTKRTNEASFIEDLAGLAEGRVEPYSVSRSAGLVPFILELLDAPPSDDDLEDYDGVVDAPLRLGTGLLQIDGDGDTRMTATVPPGDFRLRVAYANNNTSRYDYSDGADHIRLSLWAARLSPLSVRKEKEDDDDPVREYAGKRSEKELLEMLTGPSLSHRCLAVVALIQLGQFEKLTKRFEWPRSEPGNETHDSVIRVYLAAMGFAGAAAVPVLREQTPTDDDQRLRIVQTLRLAGGKDAKKLAKELVDEVEGDDTVHGMIRDSLEDVGSEGGEEEDEGDDEEGEGGWRRFEVDAKFWMIKLDGASHTVRFGKLETDGQEKTKEFDDEDAARKDYEKLVKEKTKKGYEEKKED